MKQLLPPVPYVTPVTGPGGTLSLPWTGFFKKLSQGALNILGTNTNDPAAAGYVGELLSGNSSGPAVASTGTLTNLASISLTAGDWDVEGFGAVNLAGFTTTGINVAVSIGSGALDSSVNGGIASIASGAINMSVPTGRRRISISSTTTVYLVGAVTYSGGSGSWSTNSFIRARRVR